MRTRFGHAMTRSKRKAHAACGMRRASPTAARHPPKPFRQPLPGPRSPRSPRRLKWRGATERALPPPRHPFLAQEILR
jgi:hypothetical protein